MWLALKKLGVPDETIQLIRSFQHMVTGRQVVDGDREPIAVAGGEICSVDEFPYLGSKIASSGRIDADVESRIAKAFRAFGALRKAVFLDKDLTLLLRRSRSAGWNGWDTSHACLVKGYQNLYCLVGCSRNTPGVVQGEDGGT